MLLGREEANGFVIVGYEFKHFLQTLQIGVFKASHRIADVSPRIALHLGPPAEALPWFDCRRIDSSMR